MYVLWSGGGVTAGKDAGGPSGRSVAGVSKPLGDLTELLQRRLKVVGDLLGEDLRVGEVLALLEALVFDPEDVQVQFVALRKLLVGEGPPAAVRVLLRPRLLTLVPVLRVEALDELVQVLADEWILLEREVLVGAEVVDPEPLGPRLLAGGA